jgi:hypothetical protein
LFGIVLRRWGVLWLGGKRGCVYACTHSRACRYGGSPLYLATVGGHVSCVKALIGLKADVGTDGCNLQVVVLVNGPTDGRSG